MNLLEELRNKNPYSDAPYSAKEEAAYNAAFDDIVLLISEHCEALDKFKFTVGHITHHAWTLFKLELFGEDVEVKE